MVLLFLTWLFCLIASVIFVALGVLPPIALVIAMIAAFELFRHRVAFRRSLNPASKD